MRYVSLPSTVARWKTNLRAENILKLSEHMHNAAAAKTKPNSMRLLQVLSGTALSPMRDLPPHSSLLV